MRYAALATIALASAGACMWIACDESTDNSDPSCQPDGGDCVVDLDAALPDGAPPPSNDSGIVDPAPFDAGTTPAPTCKGLFELCSGQECCSPYGCTNGTCR